MAVSLSLRDRPTLLLLPGNMCDARMWDGVLPSISGWRVECPVPRQSSIPEMAKACLSGYPGKLLPVGFSMGAIVALAIAEMAPDRVTGIGLIDVNAGADRPERAAMRPRQQRDVLSGNLDALVMDELKPSYFADCNRRNAKMLSLVLDMARNLGTDVFIAQSEALRTRSDYRHVLGSLGKPVFLACGEADTLCPPLLHEELAASISDCELQIVSDAGHFLPIERPAELGELLSSWLTRKEKEIA